MKGDRQKLHPDVLKLGLVSFLTDVSSEMIFSVFAVFFTAVAGASSALLGLIEGLADFSASSLNYLAGWLSDRSGRRKWFATAGYAFSTLAKLILLVSSSIVALSIFRVIERLGKGLRGPPRDAWLSSIAAQESRGYAFGVHKALDKAGAVIGPLVAYAMLSWLGESASTYATLFLVAFVPAVISVVVLTRIPDKPGVVHERESVRQNWQQLSPGFKRFLWPSGVFALAYFSLGFILLKAYAVGFGMAEVVLLCSPCTASSMRSTSRRARPSSPTVPPGVPGGGHAVGRVAGCCLCRGRDIVRGRHRALLADATGVWRPRLNTTYWSPSFSCILLRDAVTPWRAADTRIENAG